MKILMLIGDIIIVALLVLMVWAIIPTRAHADETPAYDLVMASYPSDTGHMLSLRSYTDVFRAPYPTEEACEEARAYAVAKHEAHKNMETLSVQLAEIFCLKNPAARGKP